MRLPVEGFASDLKHEVLEILFKDDTGELVYSKKFGKLRLTQTKGTLGLLQALLM